MNGLLLIDKDEGMTSFDVIRRLRRMAGTKKIGHAGTLDPDATGLLPLFIGNATRLISYVDLEPKVYEFDLLLGEETDTCDASGKTVAASPYHHVSKDALGEVISTDYIGEIEQVPPAYSAIRIQGKRAYERARKGESFEVPSRTIRIDSLSVLAFDLPLVSLRVQCGSGTYVRSLSCLLYTSDAADE